VSPRYAPSSASSAGVSLAAPPHKMRFDAAQVLESHRR
jgi:hypothetical protein